MATNEKPESAGATLRARSRASVAEAELRADAEAVTPLDFPSRYRRGELLGEGGMGAVFLYEDLQIGRSVALKRVQAEAQTQPENRARFIREARIQGQLEHPSIVPVYDLGVDERGGVYFSMKRVRGVTLEDILAGQTAESFSRRRLLSAFAQVCLAIDFAHERGVLHRDLKPANIMLGDYGEVYVLDWGIAKRGDAPDERGEARPQPSPSPRATAEGERASLTPRSALMGTPGYIAPEVLLQTDQRARPSTDVYALGAILFELLAGAPLHGVGSFSERIRSTVEGADARPSTRAPDAEVAPELDAICQRATSPDLTRRYPSARALHDAVDAFLDGQRDSELRRRLAGEHAARASAAADRALDGADEAGDELAQRRVAMSELGRALALEPDNKQALETMLRLLVKPPASEPPAVAAALNQTIEDQLRRVSSVAAGVYLSLFLYVPVFLWAGVHEPGWIIALYVFAGLAAALSRWVGRSRDPRRRLLAPFVCSTLALTASAGLFGPLIAMPAFVAINATAYFVFIERRRRPLLLALLVLAILLPLALELAGLVPASYAFRDDAMIVVPRAISLNPAAAYVVLLASSVMSVVMATVVSVLSVDNLYASQQRVQLFNWHLGHLIKRADETVEGAAA